MSKKPLAVVVMAGILVVAAACTAFSQTDSSGDTQERQADTHNADSLQGTENKLSAILFVNSKSCQCTLRRCQIAERTIEGIKEDYEDAIAFETLDYELQHEKAKPLVKEFNIFTLPTLVVLDKKRHVVWQCRDFSKEEPIRSRFEQLAGKAAGKMNASEDEAPLRIKTEGE